MCLIKVSEQFSYKSVHCTYSYRFWKLEIQMHSTIPCTMITDEFGDPVCTGIFKNVYIQNHHVPLILHKIFQFPFIL